MVVKEKPFSPCKCLKELLYLALKPPLPSLLLLEAAFPSVKILEKALLSSSGLSTF
jgi:hypothetical protein